MNYRYAESLNNSIPSFNPAIMHENIMPSRSEVFDPYEMHIRHCSICRRSQSKWTKVQRAAFASLLGCLAVRPLNVPVATIPLALLVAFSTWWLGTTREDDYRHKL
jgi:hypothetical protein